MSEAPSVGDRVLVLRREGRSFGAIATAVALPHARDAFVVFVQALRRQSPECRARLRTDELRRLQMLSRQLEDRVDLSADERAGALGTLARLRQMIIEASEQADTRDIS